MAKRPRTYMSKESYRKKRRLEPKGGYKKKRKPMYLGVEKKYYDTYLTATAISASATCTGGEFDPSTTSMISTPAVGDTYSSRDGKQITCDYVTVNGIVQLAAAEATANPPENIDVFIALVLDTQTNAAQMNSEDCFSNGTATVGTLGCVQRNLLFGHRFRILAQERFCLHPKSLCQDAANSFSFCGDAHQFNWFVPLKGMKINFNSNGTASVIAVVDNSIHVIAFTNNASFTPTIAYNARLRFYG